MRRRKAILGILLHFLIASLLKAGYPVPLAPLAPTSGNTEKKELLQKLRGIPGLQIRELEREDPFKFCFELFLRQPLDHNNPQAGFFEQRIFLSHAGTNQPVILELDGYEATFYTKELARMFQGNQLLVEYRFYGESKPDSIYWSLLCHRQAVKDYHRIRELFNSVYPGKWIGSGISKGGEALLIYKRFYPNDLDAAVTYVTPVILAEEDKRTDDFLEKVGADSCRQKITAFQRAVLNNRADILPVIKDYARTHKRRYSIGLEVALEYAVLEYPFSFWQWGGECNEIPGPEADAETLFEHLNQSVGFAFYSDAIIDQFGPSYYQHLTQLGYYGFPTKGVKDLLQAVDKPSNRFFAPKGIDISYDPKFMQDISSWLKQNGNRIVYLYGEQDTWTACAFEPGPDTDALKLVLKGGSHRTRIRYFPESQKQLIYQKLENWLGIEVAPL